MLNKPPSRAPKSRRQASAGDAATPPARFYYKGSRLKQLRAFCTIAKLGTLSRAAEALFLSQPSISLQLRALEQELGALLIERRRRRVVLTREGQALYDIALPLIEGFENLDQQFRALRAGLSGGELHVAAGTSTIQYLLPGFVAAFRERHPSVKLQLHNVTGRDGLALLRSDQVDFAVGSMLDVPNDLSYEAVQSYDPMLITPPEHALARLPHVRLEDLSPYGLILPPQRLTTYRLVDLIFQQRKVPFRVAIEVGGWEVIKHYVALGLGISIVTGICIGDEDRQRLAVRNMSAYFPQRSYGVVVRKGKYLSAEARAFIDLVRPGLFTRRDYWEVGHSETLMRMPGELGLNAGAIAWKLRGPQHAGADVAIPITDLCDRHPDLQVCAPVFQEFGGVHAFHGPIATLKVFEDNALVRSTLEQPGRSRVLVVDGGGSLRCALVGGQLGKLAERNGWAGLVVNGCVRDRDELVVLALGVRALAAHPRKSEKGQHGGRAEGIVEFAGVRFMPGHWLYADRDGIVVSETLLDG